jgi:hypothetical protein
MCPVNLRVPTDASKKLEAIKLKIFNKSRCRSSFSSVSLKIPCLNLMKDSELHSAMTTPTQTPHKLENSPKSSKKLKKNSKKNRIVSYKSVHSRKAGNSEAECLIKII